MIVPDLNLLIYCYNADSPLQPKAAQWWEDCLNGSEEIGLVSEVVFGFIRISTQPRLFRDGPLDEWDSHRLSIHKNGSVPPPVMTNREIS